MHWKSIFVAYKTQKRKSFSPINMKKIDQSSWLNVFNSQQIYFMPTASLNAFYF